MSLFSIETVSHAERSWHSLEMALEQQVSLNGRAFEIRPRLSPQQPGCTWALEAGLQSESPRLLTLVMVRTRVCGPLSNIKYAVVQRALCAVRLSTLVQVVSIVHADLRSTEWKDMPYLPRAAESPGNRHIQASKACALLPYTKSPMYMSRFCYGGSSSIVSKVFAHLRPHSACSSSSSPCSCHWQKYVYLAIPPTSSDSSEGASTRYILRT